MRARTYRQRMLSAISRATAGNRQTSAPADRRSRTSPRAIACAALSCLAALAWLATMETAPALAGKPATPCPSAPVRVLVDIGHTPERFGATSSRGAREFDFNKRFAEEFIDYARNGARIVPRLLSPGNLSVSLAERIALANSGDADVFLSIHHDSAQRHLLTPWVHEGQPGLRTDTIGGFSLFVSRENPRFADSLALAMEIGRHWRLAGHMRTFHHAAPIKGENRQMLAPSSGVYEAPFAVVKRTLLPAVLIEVGLLVNPAEETRLNDLRFRRRLHEALAQALVAYACRDKQPE